MRQYAINKEFELSLDKTDQCSYRATCAGANYEWSIVARVEHPVASTVIVCFLVPIAVLFSQFLRNVLVLNEVSCAGVKVE